MMSFNDAVTNCLINNFIGFDGRASRSEFWFWLLFTFVAGMITGIIDGLVFGWEVEDPMWITDVFSLIIFLPGLAVNVRRLHDVGQSGWWVLSAILVLPILLLFYWAIIEGDANPNEYGEVPTNTLAREDGINYNNY
jgi:uncharacterized membrane protein YhaH (DUF805 family)